MSKNKNKENYFMKTPVLTRVLALLLMLCMVVSVFAGCASDDDKEQGSTATTEATGTNGGSDNAGSDGSTPTNPDDPSSTPASDAPGSQEPVGSDGSQEPSAPGTDDSTDPTEPGSDEDTDPSAPGLETDEDGFVKLGLPEDLVLDREVNIIYSKHMGGDICPKEEDVGDNVINLEANTREKVLMKK